MRIFGISLVKNEEDIIESFVRYNLLIMDHLLIIDNGSTDGTLDILESMIASGLPISVTSDIGDYNQIMIMNHALLEVMHGQYGAIPDFIIPIDADEFLVAEQNGVSPRDIIQNLDHDTLHKILWRTYIPSTIMTAPFTPEGMNVVRDKKYEVGEKLIIPTNLIREGFVLNNGNHDAFAPYSMTKHQCEFLRMAHFPIRTPVQFFVKNVLGYYNRLSTKTYIKGRSKHIEDAYYTIKQNGSVSLKIMQDYCLKYCSDYVPEGAIKYEPFLNWSAESIHPQYSDLIRNNAVTILLTDVEKIVSNYRASFYKHNSDSYLETHNYDMETYRAIEQYSFKKMRVERIKRDYYQGLAALYQYCIQANNSGFQIEKIFETNDKHSTVLYGRNMISTQLETTLGFPVIESPIEQMISSHSETFDFSDVIRYLAMNKIKTVFAFDATRLEELRALAGSCGADVINTSERLINLLEART